MGRKFSTSTECVNVGSINGQTMRDFNAPCSDACQKACQVTFLSMKFLKKVTYVFPFPRRGLVVPFGSSFRPRRLAPTAGSSGQRSPRRTLQIQITSTGQGAALVQLTFITFFWACLSMSFFYIGCFTTGKGYASIGCLAQVKQRSTSLFRNIDHFEEVHFAVDLWRPLRHRLPEQVRLPPRLCLLHLPPKGVQASRYLFFQKLPLFVLTLSTYCSCQLNGANAVLDNDPDAISGPKQCRNCDCVRDRWKERQ